MSAAEIEDWSIVISDLRPSADSNQIREVINRFLAGEWDWDKEIGITNIIKGIDELNNPTPNWIAP